MAPSVKKSIVWKYFEQDNKEMATCKLCKKELKFHSSTTNLKSHLKSRHPYTITPPEDEEDNNILDPDYDPSLSAMASTSTGGLTTSTPIKKEKAASGPVINYQKLVVPTSMRSVYWKCFGFAADNAGEILTKDKIVCLLCKCVITYNRNTSNLRMHLQNRHSQELVQLESNMPPARKPVTPVDRKVARKFYKKREKGNVYSTDMDGSLILGSQGEVTTNVTMATEEDYGNLQLSQAETDQNGTPQFKVVYTNKVASGKNFSSGKPHVSLMMPAENQGHCTIESLHPFMIPIESKTVCDAIAEFIIIDMQLPDIVEGRGFQRLIATLKSPCEIPSKAKLIDEVVPRFYDSYKESVQESMLQLKNDVALMIEEWDSVSGEVYITFSVCYQQEKEEVLIHKVLSTVHCQAAVDTSYWNLILDNLFADWHVRDERIKAVVCAASRPELVEALNQKGLLVLPCLVQTLQEVCTRVCFEQDDVRDILTKCRSLIYLIYKNSNTLAALRIQDHLMSLEETPLSTDYPKVWMSTYVMLETLLARRQVIPTILDNLEPNTYDKDLVTLSDQDWCLLEDVVNVLEPFKVTMMTLSEEKAPLVSLLKPLLWQLLSCHLRNKDEDSVNAQVFKAALKTLLSEKYSEPNINQLLQVATTLDPRFKSLPHAADESKEALEGPIKQTLLQLIQQQPEEEAAVVEEEVEKKKPRLLGMVMLLGEMCPKTQASSSSRLSSEDRANLEIVQYQSESTAPLDQCPVSWWNRASGKCPNLARLAAQYLCVPATVVPASRVSLEAHMAYTLKRASLPPEIVDRLLFLNGNHHSG